MDLASTASDWNPAAITAAILAGLAAASGAGALVMNWRLQRERHHWESQQGQDRREWERDQENDRREWESRQTLDTRWDDLKRELYTRFLALADQLSKLNDDLGHIRGDLGENLETHLMNVEEYYRSEKPEVLESLEGEALERFWAEQFESEKAGFQRRMKDLNTRQRDLEADLVGSQGELHIVAPRAITSRVDDLAKQALKYTGWGRSHKRSQDLKAARSSFIIAVREDLQITESDRLEISPEA